MKKAKRSPARKVSTRSKKSKSKTSRALGPKALRLEKLDQLLLKLAPYEKVRTKIKVGQKRLEEERAFALQLGAQILDKAKDVREQLVEHYRPRRK